MRAKDLKLLEKTPCFTKSALKQIHAGSPMSLDRDIQNWIKKGILIPLKRGLYTSEIFLNREKNVETFIEYIANKLVSPSYLSCDYILQKYNLLTEAVFGVTSVTIKSTRGFQNKLGSFKFYSISPRLFTGYAPRPYGSNVLLAASKAKAFFDYLYLRQHMFREISKNEIEELRINFDEMSKKDWLELKGYFRLCGSSKKMRTLYDGLKNYSGT